MIESDFMRFMVWLCWFIIFGLVGYEIGYGSAKEKYQLSTKFICHEEVVYKWTGSYWHKLGDPCKTEAQMKGMT